jgi:hypothetical protein
MLTTDVCQGVGEAWSVLEKSVAWSCGCRRDDQVYLWTLVVFGFGVPTLKGGGGG